MVCPACSRRSALLGVFAPEIQRLALDRWELLGLLSLPDDRLLEAVAARASLLSSLPLSTREAGVCRHDPFYPPALRQLPCPPAALYLAGGSPRRLSELLARPVVAIVGSRRSTYYARDFSFALARDLAAAGITVVSGLSEGIEASAQHGALSAGGATIAVMAGGATVASPLQHDRLYGRVIEDGLAISELPPRFAPAQPWCYLARNRLLAALA
jgi:DNA processing protein